MRIMLLVSASLVAVLVPATASASATWSSWFSEESSPASRYCGPNNEAVSGVRCSGSYCDNVSIRCETLPFGITVEGWHWSNWYSEEDDGLISQVSHGSWYPYDTSPQHVCNWDGVPSIMTGFACSGRYCDNIALECAFPMTHAPLAERADVSNCSWSNWYSEEDPWFSFGVGANRFIAGVRCDESYCDDKSYYVCSMLPATNSCMDHCGGQSRGHSCWCDDACESYGDCCPDFTSAC